MLHNSHRPAAASWRAAATALRLQTHRHMSAIPLAAKRRERLKAAVTQAPHPGTIEVVEDVEPIRLPGAHLISGGTAADAPVATAAVLPPPALPESPQLSWRQFFQKRAQRKRLERLCGTGLGLSSFGGSAYYFSFVREFDPTAMFFGVVDPSIAYMLMSFAGGAAGAGAGVFLGQLLWNQLNRPLLGEMDVRDRIFAFHIAAHRAPSTAHSVDMPIPDYYGEKIKSLRGYRAWIRKHRKHMEKTGVER